MVMLFAGEEKLHAQPCLHDPNASHSSAVSTADAWYQRQVAPSKQAKVSKWGRATNSIF